MFTGCLMFRERVLSVILYNRLPTCHAFSRSRINLFLSGGKKHRLLLQICGYRICLYYVTSQDVVILSVHINIIKLYVRYVPQKMKYYNTCAKASR